MFTALIATVAWTGIVKSPTISDYQGGTSISVSTQTTSYRAINASSNELKEYLALITEKYGLNYEELYKVVECESNWNVNAVGDDGRSFGLAQFLKTTFEEECNGDYYNSYDQLKCMGEMWDRGMQRRWTCYRLLY